jgi:hypothetical protein
MTRLALRFVPLLIYAVMGFWTAFNIFCLGLALDERYGPGNPYYGEGLQMWPGWLRVGEVLAEQFLMVMVPAVLTLLLWIMVVKPRLVRVVR